MNKTKSIVCIEQIDLENLSIGGISSFVHSMIRYSDIQEIKVVGLTLNLMRQIGEWQSVNIDGKLVHFLPIGRFPKAKYGFIPNSILMCIGLVRFRKLIDGSVIHVHRLEIACIVNLLFPNQYILFLHNSFQNLVGKFSDSYWKNLKLILRIIEKWAISKADLVITLSRSELLRISKINPKSFFVPTWYDSEIFRYASNSRKLSRRTFYFGWVGRLEEQKNPLLLVEIGNELRARNIDFRILVFGSGKLEFDLLKAVHDNLLEKHIQFKGFATRKSIASELSELDSMIITSWYEGSSIALKESLGSGLPVVVGPNSDPDEIVVNGLNGFIASNYSPEEYVDFLLECKSISRGLCYNSVQDYQARIAVPLMFEMII